MKKPELLAPAGSFDSMIAAIEAGCDAVYLSGYMFGARQFATNFSEEELIDAIKLCHLYGVKVYVTVNTLIYEEEVETFLNYIDFLHKNNVDAVLIQDIGMLDLVRQTFPNLEVHASTQMHIHNLNGVKFCEKMGIKRAVLARETSIDTIKEIRKNTNIELEIFIHGALCISYSGECLMSSIIGGRSGNRGACAGSCRLPYKIVDCNNKQYNTDEYPISTKDLNSLENLGHLIDIGIDSLKIEGRMKRPEYVYLVVSIYRKAIDNYINSHKIDISDNDIKEMKKIFNRGFTKGFLFNEDNPNIVNPYRPNHLGVKIGEVIEAKKGFVTVKLIDELNNLDGVRVLEKDLGCTISSLYRNYKKVISAKKGDTVSFELKGSIKKGDTLVKTTDNKQLKLINEQIKLGNRKVDITGEVIVKEDRPLTLIIRDDKNEVKLETVILEKALNHPLTDDDIRKQIDRLGESIYRFKELIIKNDNNCFINKKDLNNIRRTAAQKLNELREYNIIYKKDKYNRNVPEYPIIKVKSCLINSKQIYDKVKNETYKNIYVEDYDLYKQLKDDNHVILKLPNVSEQSRIYKEPIMISELGGLINNNTLVSDFSLNVVNSYSVALLHSLGINLVTLSYELTKEQIERIIKEYKNRYNQSPNLEIIAYSKIEAMVSKFNLNNYYNTDKQLFLVDKFNNKYKIEQRNNLMYIIDYKDQLVGDYDDYYKLGINSIRFEFTNSDYKSIK